MEAKEKPHRVRGKWRIDRWFVSQQLDSPFESSHEASVKISLILSRLTSFQVTIVS